MKYQYVLNGEILFETNNAEEFWRYLVFVIKEPHIKESVLYNLLEKSGGYKCNMATASSK